jgi:hypothetical protein
MVEPVSLTLGVIAAGLISKALERATDRAVDAGEGVLERIAAAVRERFSAVGDEEGETALERVEDAYDSPARVRALAEAIDRQAAEPDFGQELERLIEAVRETGADVEAIAQTAIGNQNVQIANVSGSTINVTRPE